MRSIASLLRDVRDGAFGLSIVLFVFLLGFVIAGGVARELGRFIPEAASSIVAAAIGFFPLWYVGHRGKLWQGDLYDYLAIVVSFVVGTQIIGLVPRANQALSFLVCLVLSVVSIKVLEIYRRYRGYDSLSQK